MPVYMPFCFNCKHLLHKDKERREFLCKAFPFEDGIPLSILIGKEKHNYVKENQEGNYVFDPDKVKKWVSFLIIFLFSQS